MTGPGVPEGNVRSDLVSHVDIFDTLCDLCDLERPETTSGISLFGEERRDAVYMEYGKRDIDTYRTESPHGRKLDSPELENLAAGRKGIRTHDYRYEISSDGSEFLYELPQQSEVQNPPDDVVAQLQESLRDTLGEEFGVRPTGGPPEGELDGRVEENLRELGYIE